MSNKQMQKKIDRIRESIAEEVGSSTMDLIKELVELEIKLEANCNK